MAPIRVKNATNVTFYYDGIAVGQVDVPKGKTNFKLTNKIDLTLSLNSSVFPDNSSLESELK